MFDKLHWNFISKYKWSTGNSISIFFAELKNNKKFIAVRCEKCKKVLFPPQDYCEFCTQKITDLVEVGNYGIITAIAKIYEQNLDFLFPFPIPFAYICVQLKGAGTSFLHILKGEDVRRAEIGSAVKAVFKEKREGNIMDIERFQLVNEITEEEFPKVYTPSSTMQKISSIEGELNIPYTYSYGKHMSAFYEGLRDKKILATRCGLCNGVFLPPRPFCPLCFVDVDEKMVELSHRGIIKSFTTVYMPFLNQPTKPPYIYSLIVLDGCDTEIHHIIKEADENSLFIGMRVEAVWREEREGTIHDIKYFKPIT